MVGMDSRQGQLLEEVKELERKYRAQSEFYRSAQWGGVDPIRIKVLEFIASRLHDRALYEKWGGRMAMFEVATLGSME